METDNRVELGDDSGRISISAYLSQGDRIRYAIKVINGAEEEEANRLFALLQKMEGELWKWKAEIDTIRGNA